MKFLYRYQNSENVTIEGVIKARGRSAAYSRLRKQGIKPMSVSRLPLTLGDKVFFALAGLAALAAVVALVAGLMWLGSARTRRKMEMELEKGAGAAAVQAVQATQADAAERKGRPARALERQYVRGDRIRLEKALKTLFASPGDQFLAAYAEPGRKADAPFTPEVAADLEKTLNEPITVYDDELTECVDMKRIVAGMKAELRKYIADGGTFEEYASELDARQQEEIAFRAKVEENLAELVKSASKEELYTAWLKAEASLKAWGIAPVAMPRELQGYQPEWDFEE